MRQNSLSDMFRISSARRVGSASSIAARGFRPFVGKDLPQALCDLAAEDCSEVLVEAGPLVTEGIRHRSLWDEWILFRKGPPDMITKTLRQD